MEDTFFFLLEHPRLREFGLCGERLRHRTARFDPAYYADANELNFATDDDAYADWQTHGRQLGLRYARGCDTVLKIILKAKDEPDLLPHWIRHHARIVGMENLVILDCGSTDPTYRAMLESYADRLLILRYPLFYDFLHTRRANLDFYKLIAANCRYLTVLDADEFLLCRTGDRFSGAAVTDLLAESDEAVHAGTWVSTSGPVTPGMPVALNLSQPLLDNCAVAGKSVLRTSTLDRIEHIGHNMHDISVLEQMTSASFGRVTILHLATLSPAIARRRYLAHLRVRGLASDDADASAIAAIAACEDLSQQERTYARRWLEATDPPAADPAAPVTRLAAGALEEELPMLAAALDAIDYKGLASRQSEALRQ